MSSTNESITRISLESQALSLKNNIREYVIMSYQLEPNKGGRTRINLSRGKVEHAISVTNSMRQAATYLNLSYNIFKREAKKHSLWAPGKTSDVKKVHSGALSSTMLVKILRGEQMMNYRETLLLKKAFHEAY